MRYNLWPLPEPSAGLQEAPAAAGMYQPLNASPVASGFVSSLRVTGNSDILLREKAAADAEMLLLQLLALAVDLRLGKASPVLRSLY